MVIISLSLPTPFNVTPPPPIAILNKLIEESTDAGWRIERDKSVGKEVEWRSSRKDNWKVNL